VICERKSPEGLNRAGRGGSCRRASEEGQKSAESRALRLLLVVGATGVPVARALEHRGRQMWG